MTGVSAIQYYSPTIYKLVGIGTGQALKYQGISSALGLLGEACCMLTVDKIGRRWTLIGFNLLNMCTFIGATAIIGYYPLTGAAASVPTSAAYAFIAMTILYNFSFSWGCGPLSWVSNGCLLAMFVYRLQHMLTLIADRSSGGIRHSHPVEGCLDCDDDELRLQHLDWPDHAHCIRSYRLEVLPCLCRKYSR